MSVQHARDRIWLIDSQGLITSDRESIASHKVPFARQDVKGSPGLLHVIDKVKPHVLMGLSGQGGSWSRDVIEAMARHTDRPMIFPLSNPTDRAEISAQDAYAWSEEACIFASGSPFPPVSVSGRPFHPPQSNNMLIFPGVGLGVHLAQAAHVSDLVFNQAAEALAEMVTDEQLEAGVFV